MRCKAAMLRLPRLNEPIDLIYRWYEPNRKRDKDNIMSAQKFVQDALTSSGRLYGDGWRQIDKITHEFYVDKENPRVEIELHEKE